MVRIGVAWGYCQEARESTHHQARLHHFQLIGNGVKIEFAFNENWTNVERELNEKLKGQCIERSWAIKAWSFAKHLDGNRNEKLKRNRTKFVKQKKIQNLTESWTEAERNLRGKRTRNEWKLNENWPKLNERWTAFELKYWAKAKDIERKLNVN